MKHVALSLLLVLVLGSCSNKNKDAETEAQFEQKVLHLRDSVAQLVEDYQQDRDTTKLRLAMTINQEHLLPLKRDNLNDYRKQIEILDMMGKKNEAFSMRDQVINKEENSIERLIYNGLRCKFSNKKDSMNYFFHKALDGCDERLRVRSNSKEYISDKINIYVYMGKKDDAWKVVNDIYGKYPNDKYWQNFVGQFDQECKNIEEVYKGVQLTKPNTNRRYVKR